MTALTNTKMINCEWISGYTFFNKIVITYFADIES